MKAPPGAILPSEADTCRVLITPALQAARWDTDPHSIAEQRSFTDGRIVVQGHQTRCASPDELRARWADAGQRADILQQLAERGIDFPTVAAQAGKPEADPFDLLCHLAFNAPLLTRRERADRLKRQNVAFFRFFAPEAREILDGLLEKYAADGELQFTLPDVLKVRPISDQGNVNRIIGKSGGAAQLRTAVNQLQSLLYAG